MKDVFKKVHLSEKKKFFKKIVISHDIVFIKSVKIPVIELVAMNVVEDRVLECAFRFPEMALQVNFFSQPETIVVNVHLGNDKYFFNGIARQTEDRIYIELQGDLFYLQRRKGARLDIPSELMTSCIFKKLNDEQVWISGKVVDFSSGGCCLSVPYVDPIFKSQDKISMTMAFGTRTPIEVEIEVRHVRNVESDKEKLQVMGVMFLNVDAVFEAKMINLFMDLQREIFLKQLK